MTTKRAMCIESGDLPAFERGLTDQGYICIEELSRPCESDPIAAEVFEHEDTKRLVILLYIGDKHYLFKQANIAPIFESGDEEAKYHTENPKLRL